MAASSTAVTMLSNGTSDYGVDFPDLPECITSGETLEEARKLTAEALDFHIEGMTADRKAIPAPSTLDVIMQDPDKTDAVAFLVAGAARSKLRLVG